MKSELTLTKLFNYALIELVNRDSKNIQRDVSERNLCARLAFYLESYMQSSEVFEGYYADVEFNRKNGKKVKSFKDGKAITVDLIVHSRGQIQDKDNLIAIEMKKKSSTTKYENAANNDRKRLELLTAVQNETEIYFGYQIGFFLEFDLKNKLINVEKYVSGKKLEKFTKELFFN